MTYCGLCGGDMYATTVKHELICPRRHMALPVQNITVPAESQGWAAAVPTPDEIKVRFERLEQMKSEIQERDDNIRQQARDDALEEAAKIAEEYAPHTLTSSGIAKEIRALKDKQK